MTIGVSVGCNTGPKAVLTEVIPGTPCTLVPKTNDWLPFAAFALQGVLDYK